MPTRIGVVGVPLVALAASFGFVFVLGQNFTTDEPTGGPTPTASSVPVGPVSLVIPVDPLDPNGTPVSIPAGQVWLAAGAAQPSGGEKAGPGGSAASEGTRLCVRLPAGWHPAGVQGQPDWIQENAPESGTADFCRSVGGAATGPVEIRLER